LTDPRRGSHDVVHEDSTGGEMDGGRTEATTALPWAARALGLPEPIAG